jgi:Domain of unknown function (DUF4387)
VTRLRDLASLIRSKNAGPFVLTVDILFDSDETYNAVVSAELFTQEHIASLLRIPGDEVRFVPYPAGRAVKVSFPRYTVAGSPDDTDVAGGQQYAALVDLELGEIPVSSR